MAVMTGKTVLLTGGTSGIGFEAAIVLAAMGTRLTIVGRDPGRTARTVDEIRARSGTSAVESLVCDLASQAQVRRLAAEFEARHDRLDVLINNAGTVFVRRTLTEDGVEATFAINYLAPFLLTNLLLDLLRRSAPARIVTVSSAGHYGGTIDFDDLGFERGYDIRRAYARSKLAEVLFTRELARRLQGTRVTANCVHPGNVATPIWDRAPAYARPLLAVAKLFMRSPSQGAATIVYLAASPEVEGLTRLYFENNLPTNPSRLVLDDVLAARLWDASARLVHLTVPPP